VSKPLTALGLMSGTSFDGIDVALLETDGERVITRGPNMTVPYGDVQRELLRRAAKDASVIATRAGRPGVLSFVEEESTRWHERAVQAFVEREKLSLSNIDIIGYHGQTVIHRPERKWTLQLGLGQVLSKSLGVPVVFDMRANDMLHGGQGAPLVPVYHRALVAELKERPVAIVNIGGVGNVTVVGADDGLLAFDTGPGNALIDDWMKTHTGVARDDGGELALTGRVDEATVQQFLGDGYYERPAPKSLDRDSFATVSLKGLSPADGAATLVAVTALSIVMSVQHMKDKPKCWIICGGGRHNKAIMRALEMSLPNVKPAEAYGFDGDAIEAEAWAFLAVRAFRGLPLTFPGTTGVSVPVTGGVIVRPR
jgi:anhydro-N-acetylmuramic acid kinase